LIKPSAEGTGIIAGGAVRAIMEAAGIENVSTKCLGSRNPHNLTKATMDGFKQLSSLEAIAHKRNKKVEDIFPRRMLENQNLSS